MDLLDGALSKILFLSLGAPYFKKALDSCLDPSITLLLSPLTTMSLTLHYPSNKCHEIH